MKESLIYGLAALAFVITANAAPTTIKSLEADESVQIDVQVFANATGHYEYLFTKDKVVFKENKKIIGELALTEEQKGQVDGFLELISKKHDSHTLYVTIYKIILRHGDKVISTISCEVGSDLRESKKKVISLSELRHLIVK